MKSFSGLFYSFQFCSNFLFNGKYFLNLKQSTTLKKTCKALLVLVRGKWDSGEFYEIGNIWTEYHLSFSCLYRCNFCNSIPHSSNSSSSVSQASINNPSAETHLTREVEWIPLQYLLNVTQERFVIGIINFRKKNVKLSWGFNLYESGLDKGMVSSIIKIILIRQWRFCKTLKKSVAIMDIYLKK